jgi:hypothetical protein
MFSTTLIAVLALPLVLAAAQVPAPPPVKPLQLPEPAPAAPPKEAVQPPIDVRAFSDVNEKLQALAAERLRIAVQNLSPAGSADGGWKIVCGIKVREVSPAVDAKILAPPPAGADQATARRIEPPACRE